MEPIISQYEYYSVQDFVWDEHFLAWCTNKPEADDAFWKLVQDTYPAQRQNMADAREFLAHVTVRDQFAAQKQMQTIWQGIESELFQPKPRTIMRRFGWLRVAAVLMLVVGSGAIAYYLSLSDKTIRSPYAALKQIELPDHSHITLNANSA